MEDKWSGRQSEGQVIRWVPEPGMSETKASQLPQGENAGMRECIVAGMRIIARGCIVGILKLALVLGLAQYSKLCRVEKEAKAMRPLRPHAA